MLELDQIVSNMTRAFTNQDVDPFAPREDDPQEEFLGLDPWTNDDDDDEGFWDDDFEVNTLIPASQRAADIHGVGLAPNAQQRARDIHGVSTLTRNEFANKLLKREGGEYEWGGTTRDTGWDCSGLLFRVMQNNGFADFPRTSGEIIEHAKPISLKKALKTRGAVLWHEGHIAVSLGNGKTIEAMGEDYGVVIGNAEGRFTRGGILPETPTGGGRRTRKKPQPITKVMPEQAQVMAIEPGTLSDQDPLSPSMRAPTAITQVMDEMPASGLNDVEKGLRKGFLRAGRPDLARMVGTRAFDTWIGAESGWNPEVTSEANNQGLANDGLFQVWRGHEYNSEGQVANMTPAQQAYLVATKFDLSPERIREFAASIEAGLYKGWG